MEDGMPLTDILLITSSVINNRLWERGGIACAISTTVYPSPPPSIPARPCSSSPLDLPSTTLSLSVSNICISILNQNGHSILEQSTVVCFTPYTITGWANVVIRTHDGPETMHLPVFTHYIWFRLLLLTLPGMY